MKVKCFDCDSDSRELKENGKEIFIYNHCWEEISEVACNGQKQKNLHSFIDGEGKLSWLPMNAFKDRENVYWLPYYAQGKTQHGVHISLNFWQNQKFLWSQKKHILQNSVILTLIFTLITIIISIIAL